MVVGLLLLALLALVAVTLTTRRPPAAPVPELDGYLRRWRATHDGYDVTATRLLRGWLACWSTCAPAPPTWVATTFR
jgi:hypothetical protein